MPVRAQFSKSTVFKMCRQKMCRFRVNGRPIRHIFHRFQNVPASCERGLNLEAFMSWPWWHSGKASDSRSMGSTGTARRIGLKSLQNLKFVDGAKGNGFLKIDSIQLNLNLVNN